MMWQLKYQDAVEEGRTEGREEGRIEGKLEIARNALRMNMALEDIAKLTGLTREDIQPLSI